MQNCKFPNRDKRETPAVCSATMQKPQGIFAAELSGGKIEITNKLTIEIAAFEQNDNYGLQPSYFVENE